MIDTRNLRIIEPTSGYLKVIEENRAVKKNNNVLAGCLLVLSVTVGYICYLEYIRQQNESDFAG
jgi:hypothetical protein